MPRLSVLDSPARVALAGHGPLALELLELLSRPWPGMSGLQAAAVVSDDNEMRLRAAAAGIACHAGVAQLAEAGDAPSVVLACGPQPAGELRDALPPSTTVLDADACRFLAGLLGSNLLCRSCQMELDGARSLFAAVVDQLLEEVLLLDPKGFILDCNIAFLERRGVSRQDVLGRHFAEVLPSEEDLCRENASGCPFAATLSTGRTAEATYTRLDAQGRLTYHRVYAFAVRGPDGGVSHVAELRRDVTRRTEMEQRLFMSQKLAAIGELSTFLAHEIRNPLFAISGFANSLLRMSSLPDAAREKVGIILDESRRLDDILKAILNFAKPMEGAAGETDVAAVVRETMPLLSMGCEAQRIAVTVEISEGLAKARGDKDLVKQCLINLVKNAVEAMPDGGSLTVRASMSRDHVELQVRDTGVGIPEENRELVFSPFFSTKDKGSGLGLAMIKKIVEDLGGEVELASRPGQGTAVTLKLPPALAAGNASTGADKARL